MIDGSEKRIRQLAFGLQNSHVCEKRSNAPWVNKLQFLPRLRRFFLIFNQIFLASVMLNVRPLDPTPFTSFTTF